MLVTDATPQLSLVVGVPILRLYALQSVVIVRKTSGGQEIIGLVVSPTITEASIEGEVQPFAVAVIEKVTVCIVAGKELVRIPLIGLLVPLARPVTIELPSTLIQLYDVPPLNVIGVIAAPEQMV